MTEKTAMTGKLELPCTEMWKVMDGIVREGWGEDQEFSFGYVRLEMPIRH